MTPEELRADIPVCDDDVYLNSGASGPAPQRVVDAVSDSAAHHEFRAPVEEGAYPYAFDTFEETRATVAEFLGADDADVALTESTADGIARIAASLDWDAGDVVARTDLEHSAGILPWWNLQEQGVRVRVVPTEAGRLDLDAVADAVADAELFCLSSISWNYGTELPIDEVVDVAHDHDCQVLVDAVQTFGQTRFAVDDWGADFVVGAGHKWLLGPWGAGFLYVDRDAAEAVSPAMVGYRSVEEPDAEEPAFKSGAARFEVGTTSPAPCRGLQTAIETMTDVGLSTVESRIERLSGRLKDGLGDRLLSPAGFESGLVTFEAEDPTATVERLADEGIHVRELPYPEAVRASVHAFNTAEDVDALLDAL